METHGRAHAGRGQHRPLHGRRRRAAVLSSAGFHDSPFTLELTTSTEGATIYYTLDGRGPLDAERHAARRGRSTPDPSRSRGRPACVRPPRRPGWLSSKSVTSSYIFLDQVIRQPAQPEGFPASWGGRTADYAMDSARGRTIRRISRRDQGRPQVDAVGLHRDPQRRFLREHGESTPIPRRPGPSRSGRPPSSGSIPSTGEHFGVNAGIRIHGGPYSRGQNPKNAFRINFRAEYGLSRLEYPALPGHARSSRSTRLALRSIWNYSWTGDSGMSGSRHADYLRDAFARDTVRDMGRLAPHGRAVQVYINGLYWGLYIMTERPDGGFRRRSSGGRRGGLRRPGGPERHGGQHRDGRRRRRRAGLEAWNTLFAMADAQSGLGAGVSRRSRPTSTSPR